VRAITVRNLSDETHQALKARAVRNGRSTEAEIRIILEDAVKPFERLKIGSALAAFGDKHHLTDLSTERIQDVPRAAKFE
jgi:plasmid stability protein